MTRRAEIRPGVLCWVVGVREGDWINWSGPSPNGMVVTTIARHDIGHVVGWLCDARWSACGFAAIAAGNLLPISDPDADLTESTDDQSRLHDSLVAVLADARPA